MKNYRKAVKGDRPCSKCFHAKPPGHVCNPDGKQWRCYIFVIAIGEAVSKTGTCDNACGVPKHLSEVAHSAFGWVTP
jgi:hypothetical protein